MRIKINKEIREYTEAVFFGLNIRQLIFSGLACGVSIGSYFLLKSYVSTETLSWLCILMAAPFATLGFFKYNGMPAEKLAWAFIKSAVTPSHLTVKTTNSLYEQDKAIINLREEKKIVKIIKRYIKKG